MFHAKISPDHLEVTNHTVKIKFGGEVKIVTDMIAAWCMISRVRKDVFGERERERERERETERERER